MVCVHEFGRKAQAHLPSLCSEASASAGWGFLAGLSADSAGRVQEPCGQIESPQAPTAKGKSLKGQGLKSLRAQEVSPWGKRQRRKPTS